MHILVVLAHPLKESFAAAVARTAVTALKGNGHTVDFLDLYAEDFDPRLSAAERASDMSGSCDLSAMQPYADRLKAAEALIFVFPQW